MADALQGTWVFNNDVDISQYYPDSLGAMFYCRTTGETPPSSISINFNVKSQEYIAIGFATLGEPYTADKVYIAEDDPVSGAIKGWENDFYKTITITSKLSEVTNGEQLLTWLQENATKQEATRKSVDLTTLAGWEALSSGTYNITIVAKANGYRDSAPSAAVQVVKGSIYGHYH